MTIEGGWKSVDASEISPRDAYGLLVHAVTPRPIAFVSTLSPDGAPNLAPFSYFCLGGANPPSVAISPTTNRHNQPKDTLRNIEATGEYTISVVTYAMADAMNQTSFEYASGVSEWEKAGFTPEPSARVTPPFVAQSPIALECRLFQIVRHGDGPIAANYIIGEVVRFHIAERLFDESGAIDPARIDSIGRLGGDFYARAGGDSLFTLARPEKG